MTKKQVLFWRIILIFIIVLGVYFIIPNILGDKRQGIDQVIVIEKIENGIELSIRPDDFYKKRKIKVTTNDTDRQ